MSVRGGQSAVAAGFDETNIDIMIMPSIMRAARTADAVHDATLVPIDWLRHAFNTGRKKGQH